MSEVWILASVWIFLALISTFISVWLGIATALSEIIGDDLGIQQSKL